jgi:hypothetical protein
MVAFLTSLIIALAGNVAIVLYGRRRKPGQFLSWGEAMAAAAFAFFLMFWWYGVVPHLWLSLADNEWQWRPDRFMVGVGGFLEILPFTVTYQVIRDLVAVGIYGLALTLHIWHWAHWNDRSKARPVEVPASRYGRPLVRKG